MPDIEKLGKIKTGIINSSPDEWNVYADEYNTRKKLSLENILRCGKILCEAKENMGHGMFLKWLEDPRVSESERTAQRLMSVYKEFFHILEQPDKIQILSRLGISALLEMKNLPDRYRKDIEVVRMEDGKEVKEMVKVIDEDKVVDLLERTVQFEGETVKVSELPTKEFKKVVQEQQGIYTPDADDVMSENDTQEVQTDDEGYTTAGKLELGEVQEKGINTGEVVQGLALLLSKCKELLPTLEKLDDYTKLEEINEDDKESIKDKLKQLKSSMEAVVVRSMSILEKM
jgi:hypothetical protein